MILQCMLFENKVVIIGWLELCENTRKIILHRLQKDATTTRVFVEYTALNIYGNTGEIIIALARVHKLLVC